MKIKAYNFRVTLTLSFFVPIIKENFDLK